MLQQIGTSIQQVTQQAMNENGQKIFEIFWQGEEEVCIASWVRREALERRCQDTSREIQTLHERQEIFKIEIEGKRIKLLKK